MSCVARGRHVDRLGSDHACELAEDPVRVALRLGGAHAAQQLHDLLRAARIQRSHAIDHREYRLAPRRDADAVASRERRLEIAGGSGTDRGEDVLFARVRVDVDDDGLVEAEALLDLLLELRVDAGCRGHDGADDAGLLGALEQARDLRLRDAQLASDLGLAQAMLVIHASDLRHESRLAIGLADRIRCHGGLRFPSPRTDDGARIGSESLFRAYRDGRCSSAIDSIV
jgi:hypothetical protein